MLFNLTNMLQRPFRLPQIFNTSNVFSFLLVHTQTTVNNLTVTCKLSETIRKNIVNSIHTDGEVAFSLDADQCDCTNSTFVDPHHTPYYMGS